eukprot:6212023-Pleurochrysis_carterae.AAC.2
MGPWRACIGRVARISGLHRPGTREGILRPSYARPGGAILSVDFDEKVRLLKLALNRLTKNVEQGGKATILAYAPAEQRSSRRNGNTVRPLKGVREEEKGSTRGVSRLRRVWDADRQFVPVVCRFVRDWGVLQPRRLVAPGVESGCGHRRALDRFCGLQRKDVLVKIHFRSENDARHTRHVNVVGAGRGEAAA